ncbi:hypothetical protein OH492_28035 [Vibrio chagasii]|nr:hypothetical protein [Vibrio chagasii]
MGKGDIKSESTSIEFRPRPRKVSLSLNITADEPLCIDRLDMGYQGMGVKVCFLMNQCISLPVNQY